MVRILIRGLSVVVLLLLTIFIVVLLWLARPLEKSAQNINALSPSHLIAHAGGGY